MMNRRFVGLTVSAAVVCGGSIFYQYRTDNGLHLTSDRMKQYFAVHYKAFAAKPEYQRQKPSTSLWDDNWDFRHPTSLIARPLDDSDSKAMSEYKEALQKVTPTASRNIVLIRHGQYIYENEDEKCHLTKLGHEQAHLTGERLKELGISFDKVYFSTMTRATETAVDILTHLPPISPIPCNMLREGVPIAPQPPLDHYNPSKMDQFTDSARIEAAYRRYFHRADPEQKKDSNELLVCHGNVIRYFVCRSLQFPPEAWLRFSLDHGSITMITIRPNGRVFIRCIGNSGHFPPNKISVM